MSVHALFTPADGEPWLPAVVRFKDLPRELKLSAWLVYSAILDFLPPGETTLGQRYTDRMLRQSPWLKAFSRRFIQKGLKTLTGLKIIVRKRVEGRREITVTGKLAGRPKVEPKARRAAAPGPAGPIPNVGVIEPAGAEAAGAAKAQSESVPTIEQSPDTDEDRAELARQAAAFRAMIHRRPLRPRGRPTIELESPEAPATVPIDIDPKPRE